MDKKEIYLKYFKSIFKSDDYDIKFNLGEYNRIVYEKVEVMRIINFGNIIDEFKDISKMAYLQFDIEKHLSKSAIKKINKFS